MKKEKIKQFEGFRILGKNGWKWHHYQNDPLADNRGEYECFTMEFQGEYGTLVRACVSLCESNLVIDGHYGVLWLEAAEYECDPPHTERDLYDMIYAIELAEENLLRIGMPFTPDFKFHGNAANRRRRNEKLRRIYNLDELEERDE